MVLTPAERAKRYRERKKKDENYVQKQRERQKRRRENMSSSELKSHREKIKSYVKKHRELKKKSAEQSEGAVPSSSAELTQVRQTSAYKCKQTFGKAVKRVSEVLPTSPRKQREIVSVLTQRLGVHTSSVSTKTSEKQTTLPVEKVEEFLQRDDIIWQSPRAKDFISIKDSSGKKTRIQKRFMSITMQEAYEIFKAEHPMCVISRSSFCALRPNFISLRSKTPRNVCLCRQHENFRLLIEALNKRGFNIPIKFSELTKALTCDDKNQQCMTGACQICSKSVDKFLPPEEIAGDEIDWYQWQADSENHASRIQETGTIQDCYEKLAESCPSFLKHTFVKRMQSNYFEESKKKVTHKSVVLQVDFAENFTILPQNEIQSGHWYHKQVTIFTAVAWLKGDLHISYALLSDHMEHDKYAAHTFMSSIIRDIKERHPDIEDISIFSDGAASQFKQRFMFANITFYKEDFDVSVTWNFFASGHGKGAVDGVGGTIKRNLNIALRTKQDTHIDINYVVALAKENSVKTIVKFISSNEIQQNRELLDRRFSHVRALPQTHEVHFVKPVSRYIVQSKKYSAQETSTNHSLHPDYPCIIQEHTDEQSFQVGDFVLGKYAGKKSIKYYVCLINDCESDGYNVINFRKCDSEGKLFSEPPKKDECFLQTNEIIKKLPVPHFTRNKWQFEVPIPEAE